MFTFLQGDVDDLHFAKVARDEVDGGLGDGGADLREGGGDGGVEEVGGVVVRGFNGFPCWDVGLGGGGEEVVVD